ncbi:hypothetical protein ACFL35_15845 [Candidatus Riflebacteria bacterium]
MAFDEIHLNDVQGLFGGRNIYLKNNGEFMIQIVHRGHFEDRKRGVLPQNMLDKIIRTVTEIKFESIEIKQRPGVPDEAQPQITIFLDDKCMSRAKWANDRHTEFDIIYNLLLEVAALDIKKVIYSGEYKYDFFPDGFKKRFD